MVYLLYIYTSFEIQKEYLVSYTYVHEWIFETKYMHKNVAAM